MMLQEGLAGFLEEARGEGRTFPLDNDVNVCFKKKKNYRKKPPMSSF